MTVISPGGISVTAALTGASMSVSGRVIVLEVFASLEFSTVSTELGKLEDVDDDDGRVEASTAVCGGDSGETVA